MSEVTYTVNERSEGSSQVREIQTTISAEQRGARARGSTGCSGETSRCGHFTSDPPASPDSPSADFTGRYEWDGSRTAPPCTVQINMAGDYIYGWFQIDNYQSDGRGGTVLRNAVTGYFKGEVTSSGGTVEAAVEGSPADRQGRLSNVVARSGAVQEVTFTLSGSGASLEFRLSCVDRSPRMPERALAQIRTSNPVLYQAEAHPLRTMQVRAMNAWIEEILVPRMDQCFGASEARLHGAFHGLFNTIFDALGERCFGEFHRPQQTDLVLAVLLRGLETKTVTLPGAGTRMVVLEALYQIVDRGEGADYANLFRRFRALFGERGSEPVLPEHLGRYKYQIRTTYRQASISIPNSGVGLGGRRAQIRITRQRQEGSRWVQDGEPHNFEGAIGIVKVELSVGSRAGGRGGSSSSGPGVSVEGGVQNFEFQSYRRWTWPMFPGYFEVFKVEAQIKLPFGIISGPSISDVAISFYGSGDFPPLIADVENSSSTSLDNGREFQAQVGFGWFPGYLWTNRRSRERSTIDPTGLPSGRVNWSDRTFVCFEIDVETLSDAGRNAFGEVLAENLVLLQNGNSHMRLDGHASRPGSEQHNMILSIRRSQFALQALVDIAGEKLEIPLNATAQEHGDGTVSLFAYGEQEAARGGDPESLEISVARRVDLCVNGSAVARLSVPG